MAFPSLNLTQDLVGVELEPPHYSVSLAKLAEHQCPRLEDEPRVGRAGPQKQL